MVAKQDDSGNEHSSKDYVSSESESKKRADAAVHSSQTTPNSMGYSPSSTNTSDQKQKVIIPVPSYNLDSTDNYNSPQQDQKEILLGDSVIKSSDSNVGSKEYHLHSTKDREVSEEQDEATILIFDSDKGDKYSLFFAEKSRDKVIMPVPRNTLESRKSESWDENIIVPSSAHGSGSADTLFRDEQHREVKQGIQKLIMPVHYSSVNDKDFQSAVVTNQFEHGNYQSTTDMSSGRKENGEQPIIEHRKETETNTAVQAKSETLGKYDEKSKSTAQVIHGVLNDSGIPQEISPSDRKQLFGDPRIAVLPLSEIEQQTKNIKKHMNEQKQEEMPAKVEDNTVAQATSGTVGKYDKESKSTEQVIYGVLKDSGKPQEISPSDRKQLFGDPRMTALTSNEIEQQTENIKKYMNVQKQEEMPSKPEVSSEAIIQGKESPAPASGSLQSEREIKKQKVTSDTKQQQLTNNEGMQQPMGLKSLKKGAKSVKRIVSSLVADKFKDGTDVKKEGFNKSIEQPSNLKENVQKTSVTQFLYNKKYKDAEKPTNNETQELDPSVKDFADKASVLHSKPPHNTSSVNKSNVETETVKPSKSSEKKERGKTYPKNSDDRKLDNLIEYDKLEETSRARKSSIQKDNSVKYIVSERKRDSEIQRKVLENNIKRKESSQDDSKSKISDIKRIYRDEASSEKEQQKRMTDDNVSAIEKYLQQEISKVSPEKARGKMAEPKKGGESRTGENSKIGAKTEADLQTIPSKQSREQKVDKLKKTHQTKDDKMWPDTNSNTTDMPTKHKELKKAKDAISKPVKEGSGREQQKKPYQDRTPPKETSSGEAAKSDMHPSFDKYSTGENEPDMHSSFDKYSTDKNEPNMHSSFDKYSAGRNERTEETLHDTHHTYYKSENAKTTPQQKPDHTNLTEVVSHYSITDTNDTKLGHHKFQNINQQNESSNQCCKTISQTQTANLSEASTSQGINSQSITLLDSPPRYMMKDIKESDVTKPAGDELQPGITQNTAWPVHQLSEVNNKYLGKPSRTSSWGDAGTFLPWVPYVAQKKNNQNSLGTETPERHNNHHVNGYGPVSPFWHFVGRQYAVFKDNFNNHTIRGRANVAKATLLAVGLFAMWQIFKPKRHEIMPTMPIYQKCSECGTITPVEKKH